MKIKLIPRLRPFLNHKELFAAFSFFSKGNVEKFENEFAAKFKCNHGTMFQHGRSGLYALFKIWQLNDAEIICPAYTCVVVPHSIVKSGNTPVFVDCADNSPNMDYEELNDSINEKTKAIIVTHLFGYPMDVDRISEIVRDAEQKYNHKIYVIQDVAHSFGAKWNNILVTKHGDASIFGLNISKTITSIFGGMVLTDDHTTWLKLKSFQQNKLKNGGFFKTITRLLYLTAVYVAFNPYIYKIINWMEESRLLDRFVKYYEDDQIDFPKDWNIKPSEIEARVGLSQLKKYEYIIEQRIQNALQWIEYHKNNSQINFFPHDKGSTYSHCVGLVENRNEWVNKYRKNGVQLGILIEYSIPYMEAYKNYAHKEFPISKYYSNHTINFPIWVK